jgi:hypothetical protein
MIRKALSVAAAVALLAWAAPRTHAGGEENEHEPGLRLYGTAEAGPIGAVGPYGELTVNGRRAREGDTLWGGELLYAPAAGGVRVELSGLGRVLLRKGAAARVARGHEAGRGGAGQPVLIASVLAGEVEVVLENSAVGYVEAGGEAYSTSAGARVRAEVGEGAARVEAEAGQVKAEAQGAKRIYKLRPIDLGAAINVAARSTRQVQVQVTDENDKPVPDVPVLLTLSDPSAGTLSAGGASGQSVQVVTDAQGFAKATLTGGTVPGASASLTARILNSDESRTTTVTVIAATIFWLTAGGILVIAAAAAAATTAAVVTGDGRSPDQDGGGIRAGDPVVGP